MAAPGGIELHQHILLVVQDDVSESGAAENSNISGGILIFRFLRLQVWFQFAIQEILHEGLDGRGFVGTGERELLDAPLIPEIGQYHGGHLVVSDAKVIQNLLLRGRHVDEQQLALEVSGDTFVRVEHRSVVVSLLVGKEQNVLLDRRSEYFLGALRGKFLYQRGRTRSNKGTNCFGIEVGTDFHICTQIIERLQYYDRVLRHGKILLYSFLSGEGIGMQFITIGQGHKFLRLLGIGFLKHPQSEHFMLLLKLEEFIFSGNGYGRRA
mmetsp:Transcript_29478/g.49734  ORF Transcript_29478/g.49734 Transcript_29478/m.49734 type:complete len:267 (-) Transcript_29478:431-1231(-)